MKHNINSVGVWGHCCGFRNVALLYLGEALLAVVSEMAWIHIQVIVVNCERLGAFSDRRHKLLHLKHYPAPVCDFRLTKRKIGGRDTICTHKRSTNQWEAAGSRHETIKIHAFDAERHLEKHMRVLLVRSGATLSTVTSKLPRITGNLAIFSGLREEKAQRRKNKQGEKETILFLKYQHPWQKRENNTIFLVSWTRVCTTWFCRSCKH